MYLKRIEIHGFKSFADKVVVEFNNGITGIVGPNGCGKSNITDAIRWVLGEQSAKSLRGSSMSDVIFAGSSTRKAQNLAEVTLVFDNHDNYLDLNYQEIEITRRLYRQNGESEYLLNRQPCRLKDITNLVMDSGLGRDSLSIISQGNISTFADSRPVERRVTFEEAAGVSKYKKRKMETIRKLERTKENLDRIADIILEIESQLKPLERQRNKAIKYQAIKEELTKVEVSVLIADIEKSSADKKQFEAQIGTLAQQLVDMEADIVINENKNDKLEELMGAIDREVERLQGEHLEATEAVSKYQLMEKDIEMQRVEALNNANGDDLELQIETLKGDISRQVTNYNDRVARLKKLGDTIREAQKQRQELDGKISQFNNTINQNQLKLISKENEFKQLKDDLLNYSQYNHGVKSILNARGSFRNLVGTIDELVKVKDEYSLALSTALGNSYQNIVTLDDRTAKEAISFLKKNRSGRATFMPLDNMKPRNVKEEHLLVANQSEGFLGVASDFVEYDPKFSPIIKNLLGNIIIASDIHHANDLSKDLFSRYRVVTLDGDVINIGGSLTGGGLKNPKVNINRQDNLEILENEIGEIRSLIGKDRNELDGLENTSKALANEMFEKQLQYSKLKDEVSDFKEKVEHLTFKYKQISNEKMNLESLVSNEAGDEIVAKLNQAIETRDNLIVDLKAKRKSKMDLLEQSEEIKRTLKGLRSDFKNVQSAKNDLDVQVTKVNYELNSYLERLNQEYQMTFEFAAENFTAKIDLEQAKTTVYELRKDLKSLGNVNLDSIEEYEKTAERYGHLTSQRDDLIQGEDSLLAAIKQMDAIMIEKFKETVDAVNIEFNQVFRSLFGGGSAKLIYEDENDLLETGIDINVQPPGKAVQNISLFSGGEKALIAISCLFAILRVRPVPMCILDEVEAALDLANVDRFAKYLRGFSKITQFIVVTHREGTMEECDLLYGATMQQQGVTKLVSVQLEDALTLGENQDSEE